MLVKIHSAYRTIVTICDSSLLGKFFEEDKFQLDIRANYYNGEEMVAEKVIPLIIDYAGEDATFNIIGEESIQTAIRAGVITPEGVRKIQGIPFAFILL